MSILKTLQLIRICSIERKIARLEAEAETLAAWRVDGQLPNYDVYRLVALHGKIAVAKCLHKQLLHRYGTSS